MHVYIKLNEMLWALQYRKVITFIKFIFFLVYVRRAYLTSMTQQLLLISLTMHYLWLIFMEC